MKGVTIHLVRHAQHAEVGAVLSGRSPISLDGHGREQARRVGERLARVPVAAVHSSPRPRALETAEPIARRHGLPITIVDALDEIDFGAWTGRRFSDLALDPDWQRWNAERSAAPTPGGETMRQAVDRAVAHLEALAPAEKGVVCVSHCDIIRGVVAHYLGLSLDRLLFFDVDPASITTLRLNGASGRVVTLNESVA